MPLATVRIRLASGDTALLCPGDWIGRHANAALRIDDARVSEAHALLSLRGGALCLLALRGQLSLDGLLASEIRLAPKQRIGLAPGVAIGVEEIWLPDRALALARPDAEPMVLSAPIYSVGADGRPTPAWVEGAGVHIWSDGMGYRWAPVDGVPQDLAVGVVLLDGLCVVEVPLRVAETPLTHAIRLQPPLRIVARTDTTHIHRDGWPSLALDGQQGRLMSNLAVLGVPSPWENLAEEFWVRESDPEPARKRFDKLVSKIRTSLRGAGIRPDLIRPDGRGNFEVFLLPGDVVVDET